MPDILPLLAPELAELQAELVRIRDLARQAVDAANERALQIIERRIVRVRAGPRAEAEKVACWEEIAGRPYDGPRWHGREDQMPD